MLQFLPCIYILSIIAICQGVCLHCALYQNMEFVGDDLFLVEDMHTMTPNDCCTKCIDHVACGSWTFFQGICHLKGFIMTLRPKPVSTSGIPCSKTVAEIRVVESSKGAPMQLAKKPAAFFVNSKPHSDVSIQVTPIEKFQHIYGFGGAFTEASAVNIKSMSERKQEQIMKLYFGSPETSLGYSLCRTHMNSCDFCLESYSCDNTDADYGLHHFNIDHDKKYILPMMKKALQLSHGHRDLRIFASPWSPPAWMKSNMKMTGSGHPGLIQQPQIFHSWALFFSKFIKAYEAEGVKLWGITPQNEPEYAARWEACVYTPKDECDFIRKYLGPLLRKEHPNLKIIAFDHNRDHVHTWIDEIHKDGASKYVDGIGFHWYTGNSPGLNLYDNLEIAHKIDPSKFLLATEATYCPNVELGAWYRGEAYGVDILNDLLHWSVGWVDWNMVLNMQGGPNHLGNMCDAPIIVDPVADRYHIQPTYYFMGHFSKYIEPGSHRVGASLSKGQQCVRNPAASNQVVCDSILWTCNQNGMVCESDWKNCDPKVLDSNAAIVFNIWYQHHKNVEGPAGCHFGGAAELVGIQTVAFEKKNGEIVLVVLNAHERGVSYHIELDNGKAAPMFIAPHTIQTLRWDPKTIPAHVYHTQSTKETNTTGNAIFRWHCNMSCYFFIALVQLILFLHFF